MSLDNYDYTKILDDIKLISRSVKIVVQENDIKKREFSGILTEDLITRLFRDIKEMHEDEETIHNGKEYSGYLSDEMKEVGNKKIIHLKEKINNEN